MFFSILINWFLKSMFLLINFNKLFNFIHSFSSIFNKKCQQIVLCWHSFISMDFVHIFIYWVTNNKFVTFFNFNCILILYYFPQQFLYFFPEPQIHPFSVYMILWNIYSIIYISRENGSERYWYYVIHIVYIELYIF